MMAGFRNNWRRYRKKKWEQQKIDARIMMRTLQAFKPYTFKIILVLLAVVVTTLLNLVNPLLVQYVFDDAIFKRNYQLLLIYITIMCVTPIISSMISLRQTHLNSEAGQNVMRDLRSQLYQHLQQMPLQFFTATRTGEIQSRLINDIGGTQEVINRTLVSAFMVISMVVSTSVAMFIVSPLLTAISLAVVPLFLWLTYKVGEVHRVTSHDTQESMASLAAIMQETLSINGILLLKTFGQQKNAQEQFEQENKRLASLEMYQQRIGRKFFMVITTFFTILPTLIYLVAGLQYIAHQTITLGVIIAFTALQARLFAPIEQLLTIQVEIQGAMALFERIFEYLDLPIDIQEKPNALHLVSKEVAGRLTFKNVNFTYPQASAKNDQQSDESTGFAEERVGRPTLANISFDIYPGQLVALVGPSGAGKTTITYLVPRLYDVDGGAVEIDGHDVRDMTFASLGEIIGVVSQETYLFHTSVWENLLYGQRNATKEEIIAATSAAAIHERILELEHGYDTTVGERGYRLSGGEKQRLAIARVILKNPRILILDEATSALDTHSEHLVQSALMPLMQGRTTLVIAHRLSTILAADLILVINNGQIVERGTHQQLLRSGGLYTQLYNEQFFQVTDISIQDTSILPLAKLSRLTLPMRSSTQNGLLSSNPISNQSKKLRYTIPKRYVLINEHTGVRQNLTGTQEREEGRRLRGDVLL